VFGDAMLPLRILLAKEAVSENDDVIDALYSWFPRPSAKKDADVRTDDEYVFIGN